MVSNDTSYQSVSDSASVDSFDGNDYDISYDYKGMFKKLFFLFVILFFLSTALLGYIGYSLSSVVITNYLEFPQLQTLKQIPDYQDGRLIFVGDVHGKFFELEKLTTKINSQFGLTEKEKYILLGDFTIKGPDSDKVVDWMLENDGQVECIFGNHEITTLFYLLNQHKDILDSFNKYIKLTQRYFRKHGFEMPDDQRERLLKLEMHGYIPLEFKNNAENFIPDTNSVSKAHKKAVSQLGDKRIKYIANKCAAALQFPDLKLITAHAGFLPTDLENLLISEREYPLEEPNVSHLSVKSLISMKWVDLDDYTNTNKIKFENSIQWFKLWKGKFLKEIIHNKSIMRIIKGYQVIYGHNASKGLNILKRTKGMDSACVSGGELSALVCTVENNKIVDQQVISVDCS